MHVNLRKCTYTVDSVYLQGKIRHSEIQKIMKLWQYIEDVL